VTISIPPAHSFTYDGAIVNVFHANKGEGLPKHEHVYSHATFCASGSCAIRKEGKEVIVTNKTQPINLKENEWHEIEALENETVFINVFSEDKV
jgi:quercetin dioxygenase-like cupin family protein